MNDWQGKKVLIMGLGLHGGGLAVTKWFLKRGARLTVTDLKTEAELRNTLDRLERWRLRHHLLPVKYVIGRHRYQDFDRQDLIVQNPGVPRESPYLYYAKKRGIPIYNEASLFFSLVNLPLIAITGSKGKSTTTALIGHILKRYDRRTIVAGNIRETPMFAVVDKILRYQQRGVEVPIVLELSSWQLEGLPMIKRSPHIAVITNILPDHLNRYKNFSAYRKAKEIIAKYQKVDDFLVLNKEDKYLVSLAKRCRSQVRWFKKSDVPVGWRLRLSGDHNLANVAAAMRVAEIMSVPLSLIRKAVESFTGLACRMELVAEIKGVKFYNDSCATAPVATQAALQTFKQPVILLAGGSDKKLPLADLARMIKKKVKYCFLFKGDGSERLLKELAKCKFSSQRIFSDFDNMSEMVKAAFARAEKGDLILLSPAFASFSTFANEFDRAEQFVKAVKKLKG